MKLIIRKHGQFFKEVDFSGSEIILGRSNDAGVQLLHEDISRRHVKITRKANKTFIEDMGSKNGTIYQGSPIQKSEIHEGELFTVGPFSISIESVAPQLQRTVVEHSLNAESPTGTFDEDDKVGPTNTSRSMKPEVEESDSDSFLDAIRVSKKKEEEIESEAFVEAEFENDPDSEPVIEYSKPTDPYKKVPDYLKAKKASVPVVKDEEEEEPGTTPYESFSEHVEEEGDEAQIKTEIRKPESTMERSLKDFPSLTDDQIDTPESEQFFLNREIDDAGIKETFENFPDTNKIKAAKDLESSFSLATEGEISDEEEHLPTDPLQMEVPEDDHNSDAIPTESFSSPETEIVSPDEDQIKTFMFREKDLDNDLNEKTDEFREPAKSKIVQLLSKLAFIKPTFQAWMKDPKKKKIIFITSAFVFGIMVFFMMEGGNMFRSEPVDPDVAINSETGFQKLGRGEKKRVILFQIDQIQKLISGKDVAAADERMRKLMTLASKDADFVKFEKEYQKQRDDILAEEARKQKDLDEKEKRKEEALKEAKKMIDSNQFGLAKKTYMRVLELFPDDPDIQEKIQTLELLQEQEERKSFAKKQRYDMLSKIFNEGIQKYESGQLGQAQKLFKQVASEKGHPKYKKASEYLSRIDSSADKKINQKIAAAKTMILSPDTLIAGYQELKKIVSQFPLRADAKKLLNEAKLKMDKKARELYADALAQEELAGDPAAALDLYKEVLKYAPDKSNKYNQKAQEKINSLQL